MYLCVEDSSGGLVINGQWSVWDPWSSCSITCDGGTQQRVRRCDDPAPQNGGSECIGVSSEGRPCDQWACPGGYQRILFVVGRRSSVVGRRSSVVGRRSSVVGRRSSVVGRRSSVVGRRSSVVGRRSSVVGRRSSVVGRRSSVVGRRSSVVGRRSSVVGRRSTVVGRRVVVVIDIFIDSAPMTVSVNMTITTSRQSSLAALLFNISLLKYYLSQKLS